MDTGNGEVERILRCLHGQCLPSDEGSSERNRGICHVHVGETLEHGKASLVSLWITRPCLSQYHLRREEIVVCPLLLPPRHGQLLMGSNKQITAWPCREITGDTRFDIDGGFCAACV